MRVTRTRDNFTQPARTHDETVKRVMNMNDTPKLPAISEADACFNGYHGSTTLKGGRETCDYCGAWRPVCTYCDAPSVDACMANGCGVVA